MIRYYKILVSIIAIGLYSYNTLSYGYFFGLKSADNTVSNIQNIQSLYGVDPDVVSFIFDGLPTAAAATIEGVASRLGTGKVYHIALSPEVTPLDINKGSYDAVYNAFFELIKKHDIQVIFRTMHEMNGGWYHRSGDPIEFKKSRNRVWQLSRKAGLDQSNILFDFSVNHVDMPAIDNKASQHASLITCTPYQKTISGCYTLEDYRPGNDLVDIVGFSMYNRGKGGHNRLRLTPEQIIYDAKWDLLDRLSLYNKPIIIDEVGTTSARYNGHYDRQVTVDSYLYDLESKNKWLEQLKHTLDNQSLIKGAVYFNVDYTRGHTYELRGESDRAVLDVSMNKVYHGIYPLLLDSKLDKNELGFNHINNQAYDPNYFQPKKPISLIRRKIGSKNNNTTTTDSIIQNNSIYTSSNTGTNMSGSDNKEIVQPKTTSKPIFD